MLEMGSQTQSQAVNVQQMVKSLDAGNKGYVTIDDFKGLYDVLEAM